MTIAAQRWQREHYTGLRVAQLRASHGPGMCLISLFCFLPGQLTPAQLRPLSHPGSWPLCSCSPAQTWTHLLGPSSLGQEEWAAAAAKPVLPENIIQEKPSLGEARPRRQT